MDTAAEALNGRASSSWAFLDADSDHLASFSDRTLHTLGINNEEMRAVTEASIKGMGGPIH